MRAWMMVLCFALAALFLLLMPALTFPEGAGAASRADAAARNPDVIVVADQADAALVILDRIRAGRAVRDEDWRRLRESEGYRRLRRREESMGRAFRDSVFVAFLHADSTLGRAVALRRTVDAWKRADLAAAGRRALAYLPHGAAIRAKVYLTIKPWTNSFVFETTTDPAIFLYADPAVPAAKFENTVAHELHHIGYAGACAADEDTTLAPTVASARLWMGAFGEGVAMLAAAGGPDTHPHAVSDPVERGGWDRSMERVGEDLRSVESFFLDILDGRAGDADSVRARAMGFFGVQGPWYTVGYHMAAALERAEGRDALIATLCDPPELLRAYTRAALRTRRAGEPEPPLWSERLLSRLTTSRR
jgi:hypothetical protein